MPGGQQSPVADPCLEFSLFVCYGIQGIKLSGRVFESPPLHLVVSGVTTCLCVLVSVCASVSELRHCNRLLFFW